MRVEEWPRKYVSVFLKLSFIWPGHRFGPHAGKGRDQRLAAQQQGRLLIAHSVGSQQARQ